jgi:hypothetical protein
MRHRIDLALVSLCLCACSNASGSLQGGQQLALPAISESGTGSGGTGSGGSGSAAPEGGSAATWSNIYAQYIAPMSTGGCGFTPGACHQAAMDSGATLMPKSGFVCGTSKQSCYMGMLNATPPLVSTGTAFAADPTKAPLYMALWQGDDAGSPTVFADNMPLTMNYSFGASDLALIAQWIKDGAPNN